MARFVAYPANQLVPSAQAGEYVVLDTSYPATGTGSPQTEGFFVTYNSTMANKLASALNTVDPDWTTL